MLACKVGSRVPQTALCASIWCSCLALLRGAFFADAVCFLFPLCFGERVFAFHLPTLLTRPFVQVLLAQRVPVHRLLLPHVKQKLPSERQASLKRCQRERKVDQDLLSCTASRHADVCCKWIHATEIGDDARLCSAALNLPGIALPCIALHCIALHFITLHCITLHCSTLHCMTLHCIALHCIIFHCITLHCITLHCISLHCIALHYLALFGITLHYIALHYISLHCIALHCIAFPCIALHYIALHGISLHYIAPVQRNHTPVQRKHYLFNNRVYIYISVLL